MRYLLLSVLVVCMIGVMVPSVFAELTELNDFKKFIPDYYNYQPEKSSQNSVLVELNATFKDDEKSGTVVFMGRSDLPEGFIWELFNDQKNQFAKGDMVYGYRDHIPGLPPTCYEAMYVVQSYEFVQCIKDDVIIFVMTNYGDSRSVMKQILNKMDGQLSLPGTGNSIDPLYIIIAVVGIGGVIGAIAVAKRGSKTPKPDKQKPKEEPKKKETSAFCENCGNTLNPKAKFCGGWTRKVNFVAKNSYKQ